MFKIFALVLFSLSLLLATRVFANSISENRFNFFDLIFNGVGTSLISVANIFTNFIDTYSVPSKNNTNDSIITSNIISEDAHLTITELGKKYGYNIEEHEVTTEDGYVIKFHRIPYHRLDIKLGPVVFLMHGILDSSDSWILQGPNNALGYILAEEGYDVWMGNARGNKHALKHKEKNATDSDFWRFTWEEIGLFDLPAMIDYVLNLTKQDGLYYIGHSQGTTSFYVMASMRPEYNEKVKLMFSLAPVAWMSHVKSPVVRMFSPVHKLLGYLTSGLNLYSPSVNVFKKIIPLVCYLVPIRCDNIIFLIVGDDHKLMNTSIIPVILGHMPTGSSTGQFIHYGQLIESGKFARFDYGILDNISVYGQATPPDYDLSNITIPMVLYYSGNDWLSDPRDVETLMSHLPNVIKKYCLEDLNHFDILYAKVAKELIYLDIIDNINDFEEKH